MQHIANDASGGGAAFNSGRKRKQRNKWLWWIYPITGFAALLWLLLRVVPKPSRAAYPCMRVAAPIASSFILWLIAIGASAVALRKARFYFSKSKIIIGLICTAVGIVSVIGGLWSVDRTPIFANLFIADSYEPTADPVNDPIGVPKGWNPGRVVWVYDPDATSWGGPESGESCWEPSNTNQAVVDSMMSRAVRWLAGEKTDNEAWDVIFRYFNQLRGYGKHSYQAGEKIAIKINLTTSNATNSSNKDTRAKTRLLDKAGDTTPQMILALLRQLVNVVGVNQSDISVGDPTAFFTDPWYKLLSTEFPQVNYLDHYPYPGRTPVQYSSIPLYWSTADAGGKLLDYIPVSFAQADYLINLAVLKGHETGITVCAKNHYGSLIRNPVGRTWGTPKDYYNLHDSLPYSGWTPGRGYYRALVDLMGHRELGAKTVLYLIDGLYGGYYSEGTPFKWEMAPFNGNWPSSLFVSHDPVAIDSVAYDFLLTEWPHVVYDGKGEPDSLRGGAQDYLHEAALAADPPSGSRYDPENDGYTLASLGVHEHWNNSIDKQYSRNLGTGEGIELISSEPIVVYCAGDHDEDGDIDGGDLADYAIDSGGLRQDEFAANFGNINCP